MKRQSSEENLPLSRTRPVADDVRGELEFHLHERARELELQGMTPQQAMAEARVQFGDREAVEAACEEIETRRRGTRRRTERFAALRQDVVVGLRVLRKSPAFTAAAILMLALGIGANSAVFSIVNRVVLQPLPYVHSDQLVTITERHENGGWGNLPWPNFLDVQAQSTSFSAIAAYGTGTGTVLGTSVPLRVKAGSVSSAFFRVFPIAPFMGRVMSPDEHTLGALPVAVVSYAFWRDHLGAPASLAGAQIRMDRTYDVVGVAPPDFDFPDGNQVWTALELDEQGTSRTAHNWQVVGRMKAGTTPSAAEKDVSGVLARLSPQYQPDFDAVGANVVSLQETLNGSYRTPLLLLLGASALVLVAACVNLAGSMLARGTARSGEFTVRFALGATRTRVVQQLVTESALLAIAGTVAGLLLAALLLRLFGILAPEALHLENVHVDGWVQAFAFVVAAVTTLVFGLLPALRMSGENMSHALREGTRGTSGARRMRVWNLLVATEVALAVVLLSSSALLIKSFSNVMQNKLGFDSENILTVRVNLPEVNYESESPRVATFHEELLARLRAQPGISAAGFANVLPLGGSGPNGAMLVEGKPMGARGPFNGYSIYRVVGGNYFDALHMPVLKGRTFRTDGGTEPTPAVVVDESFAREQWPGVDPIGKRVKVYGMDRGPESWYTVIGVVANVRTASPTSNYSATYYFDHRTRPASRTHSVSYVIRSTLTAAALAPLVRKEVAALDPQVPLEFESFDALVSHASAARKFPMLLIGAFAAVALMMAVVGIYAVVSYAVSQRTREIGVRLALGATPVKVRALVLRSALRGVVPGLLAGAALSMAAAGLLANQLYGVSPFDPLALMSAVALLGLAAMLSIALPAIRASRVDPLVAMRAD